MVTLKVFDVLYELKSNSSNESVIIVITTIMVTEDTTHKCVHFKNGQKPLSLHSSYIPSRLLDVIFFLV